MPSRRRKTKPSTARHYLVPNLELALHPLALELAPYVVLALGLGSVGLLAILQRRSWLGRLMAPRARWGHAHSWAQEALAPLHRITGLRRDGDYVRGTRGESQVWVQASAAPTRDEEGRYDTPWEVLLELFFWWAPPEVQPPPARTEAPDLHDGPLSPWILAGCPAAPQSQADPDVSALSISQHGLRMRVRCDSTAVCETWLFKAEALVLEALARLDAPFRTIAEAHGLEIEAPEAGRLQVVRGTVGRFPFELERRAVRDQPGWQLEIWLPGLPPGFALRKAGGPGAPSVPLRDPILATRVDLRCPDPVAGRAVLETGDVHGPLLTLLEAHPRTRVVAGRLIIEAQGEPAGSLVETVQEALALAAALDPPSAVPPPTR